MHGPGCRSCSQKRGEKIISEDVLGGFFSLYCHFISFPSLEQSRRKGQIIWPPLPLRKICQHAGGQHATKMPGFHRNVIETNEWLNSECEGGSQEDFKVHKKAGWSEVEGGCRTGMIISLVLALCYLTRKTGILSFSQVHQYSELKSLWKRPLL